MLKVLRNKKTTKKIWIGLAIIIMPAFIFWGFGGAMRDKDEKGYIGIISGKKIPALEFKDSLSAVRNAAIMQYGENLQEIEKTLNLESQAWQRLVLLEAARKFKIKASDQEVIKQVGSYPFFKRNGTFDSRVYADLLKYVFRTQARAFEEQTRQNIIISKLFNKITDGIIVEDKEIREEYLKIKSVDNPKFKFDENKFLSEKKEFGQIILEGKKQEYFSKFIAGQLK
jgi:peptidyl-prolyl cis-trans isomerase D